jgi:hypothetical protein
MTAKDAYMFPVVGSCVLFGLYTLFKLFSKASETKIDFSNRRIRFFLSYLFTLF